jgi:hypothetical protein
VPEADCAVALAAAILNAAMDNKNSTKRRMNGSKRLREDVHREEFRRRKL